MYCDFATNTVLRSGQVRSECLTCTFRASCCSPRRFLCLGQELSKGGTTCTGGYKGVRAVRHESVILYFSGSLFNSTPWKNDRLSDRSLMVDTTNSCFIQCSMTGITKAVVCVILSVG